MLITEFGANWVRNKEPVAGNELYGKGMNRKVAIAITVVLCITVINRQYHGHGQYHGQ